MLLDDIKTYIIELGCKILLTQNQHLFFCEFLCSSIAMLKLMWIFVTQSFKYALYMVFEGWYMHSKYSIGETWK